MGYKLLGMLMWNGAKLFLRRKYGAAVTPKPLLAGAVVLIALAVAFAAAKRPARGLTR
jgi:hypothetical protein